VIPPVVAPMKSLHGSSSGCSSSSSSGEVYNSISSRESSSETCCLEASESSSEVGRNREKGVSRSVGRPKTKIGIFRGGLFEGCQNFQTYPHPKKKKILGQGQLTCEPPSQPNTLKKRKVAEALSITNSSSSSLFNGLQLITSTKPSQPTLYCLSSGQEVRG
jgi:hypothetical protein